jgi:hypothetical protein
MHKNKFYFLFFAFICHLTSIGQALAVEDCSRYNLDELIDRPDILIFSVDVNATWGSTRRGYVRKPGERGSYPRNQELLTLPQKTGVIKAYKVAPSPTFYWREKTISGGEKEREMGLMVKIPLFAIANMF